MGQKHSKDRMLYQQVIAVNVDAIRALSLDGAGLEWKDKHGNTPLLVACKDPRLCAVAKTLIELGANVNAYCHGRHGGTPLHYAAKGNLDQIVRLLLSHGANAFVRNRDHQTPLEVARKNRCDKVVRVIEGHICYFSGYICEIYGPGFSDASAPRLSSRKIWVVVVPCSPHNPPRRPRLELVMYSSPQDAEPRKIIALRRSKIKEPKFNQTDPALLIFDKRSKTHYKFASLLKGDKQQLRWLYNACKGISQGVPPLMLTNPGISLLSPVPVNINFPPSSTNDTHGFHWDSDSLSEASTSYIESPLNNSWVTTPERGEYSNMYVSDPNPSPIHPNSSAPSAPPMPDVSSGPVVQSATSLVTSTDQQDSSKLCVICWDAPSEGACIPCGHVAACMSCLNKINASNCVCPICRCAIDRVIKLYGV